MELRHFRYFVAVAEELHFRRAAERLHVAQPAISEQIRKLEDELGVKLLERTQRNVCLTDAGAAFLVEARRVLRDAELARLAARSATEHAYDQLQVGYSATVLPTCVLRALQRVTAGMANLETRLEQRNAVELLDAVRAGNLDAAVVSLPAPTSGLRTTQIADEQVVAALPVNHRHAVAESIRLDHVLPERIAVMPREANRPLYDAIIASCHRAGLSPTLQEVADGNLDAALLTVAAGSGMALLPASVAERRVVPGIRFVPLAEPQPAVATAVLTRRDSTHLPTAAFLRALGTTSAPTTAQAVDAQVAMPAAA